MASRERKIHRAWWRRYIGTDEEAVADVEILLHHFGFSAFLPAEVRKYVEVFLSTSTIMI